MMSITYVRPEYTGGGIYCFLGRLAQSKRWFLADTNNYDVRILNASPFTAGDDVWDASWQEAHLVKDLNPEEALNFFIEMLNWIREFSPSGNYLSEDMDTIREEVERLKNKNNWR